MDALDYRRALIGILAITVDQVDSTDNQAAKEQRSNRAVTALFTEALDAGDTTWLDSRTDVPKAELLALLNASIVVQSMLLEQWASAAGEPRAEVVRRFALLMASLDE